MRPTDRPDDPWTDASERQLRGAWRRASATATLCEGAIHLDEMRAAGLTDEQVWHAARTSRLFRRFRAVYLLGHEFTTERARLFLAMKALGRSAVLSHASAAAFWGLLRRWDGPVHITVPTQRRRRRGIVVHVAGLDPRRDVVHRRGFAVTTVAQTLADCAGTVAPAVLEAVVSEAEHLGMLTPRAVEQIRAAVRGRPGARALGRLLDARDPGRGRPRGWLEKRWARFAGEWGLPRYDRGRHIDVGDGEMREIDVLFPATAARGRRIVELDVFATHDARRQRFGRDRRRDRRLVATGDLTMRVTEDDFLHHEAELAEDVWRFLGDDARADAIRDGARKPHPA